MLSKWVNGVGAAYHNTVWRAVTDTHAQSVFRRDPEYINILGVSDYFGRDYLRQIDDPTIMELLHASEPADQVGGPYTHDFLGRQLSPNTIRYAKVLQDLVRLFPRFDAFEQIAEIGVGYGGQARIISEYAKVGKTSLRSYDLIDILPVCLLAQGYLDNFRMQPACRYMTKSQVPRQGQWDLVISNYAFSEFDADLEREYLDTVVSRARCGYLTMNSGLSNAGQWGKQSYLPVEQLLAELPNAVLLPEEPVVYPTNYIIVFGQHSAGQGVPLEEMRAIERRQVAEYQRATAAAQVHMETQAAQQAAQESKGPPSPDADQTVQPAPTEVQGAQGALSRFWAALSGRTV